MTKGRCVEFTVLYTGFSWIIYFIHKSVYVSVPNSWFIPLSFSFCLRAHSLWSLCLCVYYCFINKIVYTIFFFRFHIYALIYDICFSLSDLTSLCTTVSRSTHVSPNDPISLLFYGWVVFHCIHIPRLLYPFLCWWAFPLSPCLGCCK